MNDDRHSGDDHGYVAAALAGLAVFEAASRGSGRTTCLIERCRPGDRIVVLNAEVQQYVRSVVVRAGIADVEVLVVDPTIAALGRLIASGRRRRRTFLDDSWSSEAVRREVGQIAVVLGELRRALAPRDEPDPVPRFDDRNRVIERLYEVLR